jgi:hypothetical protein
VATINKKVAVIPKRIPRSFFVRSLLSLLRGVHIPKKAIGKGVVNFVEKAKKEATMVLLAWNGRLRTNTVNNRKIVGTSKPVSISRMRED